MYLGSKLEPNATWWVSSPNVGSINALTGAFTAEREPYRQGLTKVVGVSEDGKQTATADVHIIVGRGLMSGGPVFVDGRGLWGPFESIRWNDQPGRRAAILITEALWQLPKEFLDAVGEVALVRVKTLRVAGGELEDGMHLPLGTNCVLLAEDSLFSTLEDKPEITPADEYFVSTFIHELAHVAMSRKSLSVLDRQWLESVINGILTFNTVWVLGSALAGYLRFYSPLAGQDFCSDYARVSGWVVNNPNPLSLFWNDVTVLPNIVTGLILFGQHAGLRNTKRVPFPVIMPPSAPLTDDEKEDYCQRGGFASCYGATDVHEDWAEAVMSILMNYPVVQNPAFAARKKFIEDSGVVPRVFKPIVPGSILNDWALRQGLPAPDIRDWAVYFGNYAGQPRFPQPIVIEPAESVKLSAKRSLKAANTDGKYSLGEGAGVEHPSMSEYRDETFSLGLLSNLAQSHNEFAAVAATATTKTRAEVAALAVPLRTGTTLEFLRTAECHGQGLVKLSLVPAKDDPRLLEAAFPLATGDVICDVEQTLYVVSEVDERGRLVRLVGTPLINERGRTTSPKPDARTLRFLWRPDHRERTWNLEPGASEKSDFAAAMIRMVRLWGETIGAKKRDLSTAGGFVSEALDAAGIKLRNVQNADTDEVAALLDQYGSGLQIRSKNKALQPAVGDFVRLAKSKLWGLCTRAADKRGELVDVLVQGGMKPNVAEPEDAVILVHAMDQATIAAVWRPSGKRR
jgi:hypothetical protein